MQFIFSLLIMLIISERPVNYNINYINDPRVRPTGLEMIPVEGGIYTMGQEPDTDECPHEVKVQSFAIGKYEVTQADWMEIMGKNPSFFTPCDNCPVEQVSWDDVQEYIKKLNLKYNVNYRLPTEEEWEYAALGGQKSKNYAFAGNSNVDQVAWYVEISKKKTHPVGTLKPNELGIYNMSGNVIEWCSSNYKPYICDHTSKNQEGKVLRGGAWSSHASSVRIRDRNVRPPDFKMNNVGFRLAK